MLGTPRLISMPSATPPQSKPGLIFADLLGSLARVLDGAARRSITAQLMAEGDSGDVLAALRRGMRAHTFATDASPVSLRRIVDTLDARTRKEGLHVLHGWDYRTHKRPDDIAPVLLLDYCTRLGVPEPRIRESVELLLDQYWTALLALIAVRAWDDGDPNANLDRISQLVRSVNGPDGSGNPVVDDAESLLMLAVAYYHPEEQAYDELLAKVWTLDAAHRLRVALPAAAILGSHLRWGLRFMYQKDVGRMRDDNIVDYPWVLFALSTLMHEYERMQASGEQTAARERVVEALFDGLSADPWAFTGKAPAFLSAHEAVHAELRSALGRQRDHLLEEFGRVAPTTKTYSPLGLGCNFLSNAAVATAAIALEDEARYPSLNALFTRAPSGEPAPGPAERYARRLMQYAAEPARLGAGGAPLIVYDPYDSVHYYNTVVRTLKELK
ncbi:MAG: hypothetical protein NTX19_07575 [Gemmatimonadetes bacterium]|nr:hypothetical protein [Gemmatimonadota bacterium]